MRKLSIEKMETKTDTTKLDKFVGASFERNEETEECLTNLKKSHQIHLVDGLS